MKNNENKKGFTLIELLAVIIILAVLILLATPAILNITANTQRNAFLLEARTIADAGERAYIEHQLSQGNNLVMHRAIRDLDLRKTFGPEWAGCIRIQRANINADPVTTIWLTNGNFWIDGATRTQLDNRNFQFTATSLDMPAPCRT